MISSSPSRSFSSLKKTARPPFAYTVPTRWRSPRLLAGGVLRPPPTSRERLMISTEGHPSGPAAKFREEAAQSAEAAAQHPDGQALWGGSPAASRSVVAVRHGNLLYGRTSSRDPDRALRRAAARSSSHHHIRWDRPSPRPAPTRHNHRIRNVSRRRSAIWVHHALAYPDRGSRSRSLQRALQARSRTRSRRSPLSRSTMPGAVKPDVVSLNTCPHARQYAIKAMERARTCSWRSPSPRPCRRAARRRTACGRSASREGYILRHIPRGCASSARAHARTPLVFADFEPAVARSAVGDAQERMATLSRSSTARALCGHLCQITRPTVSVHAVGPPDRGPAPAVQLRPLEVTFGDSRSAGTRPAGAMMSETAFFVKDVIGPKGPSDRPRLGVDALKSDDINAHTQTTRSSPHAELKRRNPARRRSTRQSTAQPDDLCGRAALSVRHRRGTDLAANGRAVKAEDCSGGGSSVRRARSHL